MNVGWVRINRVLFRGEQEKPAKHFRNYFTTYRTPVEASVVLSKLSST